MIILQTGKKLHVCKRLPAADCLPELLTGLVELESKIKINHRPEFCRGSLLRQHTLITMRDCRTRQSR